MPRSRAFLLALLMAMHSPFAGASAPSAPCTDGGMTIPEVVTCPNCAGPAMPDPVSGDSGCPTGGLASAHCTTACAGLSGLSAPSSSALLRAVGERVADAPCERYASLARSCPKPPPRTSL